MGERFLLILCMAAVSFVIAQNDLELPQWRDCAQMLPRILVGFKPRGNTSAGLYLKSEAEDIESCVAQCCSLQSCNVVLMYKKRCFQIECENDNLCEPVYVHDENILEDIRMVLVRPVAPGVRWEELYDLPPSTNFQSNLAKSWLNNIGDKDPMEMAESRFELTEKSCLGNECHEHEHCVSIGRQHRGICMCNSGYARESTSGLCVLSSQSAGNMTAVSARLQSQSVEPTETPFQITKVLGDTVSEAPVKSLTVSAVSKIVRLPENEATLSAYTVPAEQPGEKYNYEWKLLSQPEGSSSGTMTDQNGGTLKLSNLSEGLYMFKVAVSGPGVFGEAFANVTVMPPKRINKPPIAVIKPATMIVKLPNTVAVLDGSASSDDDEIISWHWELHKGPIGYQPHLDDTPTLQMKNLNTPGNYTFMLTVEDSDHKKNSTMATITVLKVPDYPPVANAGQGVILYLPHNSVTLNGSLSTDDKGIVSWEWTKLDQEKAVDMQKTRTPYLELSNLEEGMYTFVLKVTDDSDQSDTSSVHVFVKPPTNNPPKAVAGQNLTIALPQTSVLLNGSKSTDDFKIISWKWEQLTGPNKVSFTSSNTSVTNVTGLTKGLYLIQLTVEDGNGNSDSNNLSITVNQNSNAPPKANAGGDQTIILPVDVLVLNGSHSEDDLGIAKWQWTREPTSLALGTVIAGTETSPVLMLINVVAGRYVFRLKVTDDQGEWEEDTVSVIVKPDPHFHHLVELTLNIESNKLSKSQIDSVVMKLGLLLRDAASLVVRTLRTEETTGRAVLVFYVQTSTGAMSGPTVVRTLKNKLAQDSVLLQLSVAKIQTTICQNNCSGHGVCDQGTRSCMCEAFWMEDLIRKHFRDGDSNCDWSILYVVIALFIAVILIVSCIWSIICLCARLCCHRPTKRQRYALLENNDDIRLPLGKQILSESESDSDVLFETKKSNKHLNGDSLKWNGPLPLRNGFKKDKRIKT